MKSELGVLKKFILFLVENEYNPRKTLCYAIPKHRVSTEKIITTLTPEIIADIMEDDPDSIKNKRDKAFCLLALNIGLRSSDIRNLKFCDIDWEQGTLSIRQQKTNVALQLPLDNETQNAIIDYILHERRDLKSDYIFITAVGGARKIAAWHYRIKRRAKNTSSFSKIPHDGLHILRRTFASNLLKCGTPLATISEMMGHIDKNIVKRYLSTDDEKMKRCSLDLSLIPCRKEQF
jgi:integrase